MHNNCIRNQIAAALRSIIILGLLCGHAFAFAQSAGNIDSSWNPPSQPYLSENLDFWASIATQPNGKVVLLGKTSQVVGKGPLFVRRFNHDGALDTSFGSEGTVYLDGVALKTGNLLTDALGRVYIDGEIRTYPVVNGVTYAADDYVIVRLLRDGALDATFGSGGIIRIPYATLRQVKAGNIRYFALQPDEKLLLATNTGDDPFIQGIRVTRLHPDGRVDTSFGTDGAVSVQLPPAAGGTFFTGFKVLPDGSFVLTSTAFNDNTSPLSTASIYKWTAQGAVDTSFGMNGVVVIAGDVMTRDLKIQKDGRILVSGERGNPGTQEAIVVRFTSNGTLDAEFGEAGYAVPAQGSIYNIALESGGEILARVLSNSGQWYVIRLHGNGDIDSGFARADIPDQRIDDIALANGLFLLTSMGDPFQKTRHIEKLIIKPWPRSGSLSTDQTPSLSGFLVEMHSLSGASVDTVTTSHVVGVDGYIFPQNTDIGARADIFVVAASPRGMYMRNIAGNFVPWSNHISDLVPAYEDVPLTAPMVHVPIYGGRLPFTGSYSLYSGYMRSDGGPLLYIDEPMTFKVVPQ